MPTLNFDVSNTFSNNMVISSPKSAFCLSLSNFESTATETRKNDQFPSLEAINLNCNELESGSLEILRHLRKYEGVNAITAICK